MKRWKKIVIPIAVFLLIIITASILYSGDRRIYRASDDWDAGNDGYIDTDFLGTGTADNTTYLRGDQTWQTIVTGGTTGITPYGSDGSTGTIGTENITFEGEAGVSTTAVGNTVTIRNTNVDQDVTNGASPAFINTNMTGDISVFSESGTSKTIYSSPSGNSDYVVASNGENWVAINPGSVPEAIGLVIGTNVQGYDVDTAKVDVNRPWTADQDFSGVSNSSNTPTDNSHPVTLGYLNTGSPTPRGTWVFSSGAVMIPQAADPDLTAAGQITYDTDNHTIQIGDGINARDVVTGHTVFITVSSPDSIDDPNSILLIPNETGKTWVITTFKIIVDALNSSPAAGVTCDIVSGGSEYALNFAGSGVSDLWRNVVIDQTGNSCYYTTATGVTPIPAGQNILMDFGDGSSAGTFTLIVGGYLTD